MYEYYVKRNGYRRTTQTTAFSLPINLLDKLNETLLKDRRFKNRSELATKLFSDYVNNFERDESFIDRIKNFG